MSSLLLVPASAPSFLTVVNKTATTITVNWTVLDSSDADGYVVNVTSDIDTVQTVQVEGSSNNTITLNGLRRGTIYNITVRAYQQLLGPASSTISVQTLPGKLTCIIYLPYGWKYLRDLNFAFLCKTAILNVCRI